MEFATATLITGHRSAAALPLALSLSSTPQFTGIVHLSWTTAGLQVEHIERLHHTSRPNGKRLPQQCPECRAYRSWQVPSAKPKKYNREVVLYCGTDGCSGIFRAPPLEGYRPLAGDVAKLFSKPI